MFTFSSMKTRLLLLSVVACFFIPLQGQVSPNVVDKANLKQGHWTLTGKNTKKSGYKPDQVVEEGFYKDGLKEGKWTKYHNNGRIQHVLSFKQNKLNGLAIFYYRNGNKKEEGIWKKNRWTSDYKYFYKNGNLRHLWKYSDTGKRTGVQKYYHENGKLKLAGAWENGKESGPLVEFYNDGSVKSERFFEAGKMDINKSKKYKITEKPAPGSAKKNPVAMKDSSGLPVTKKIIVVEKKPFDGNGFNEFYNKDGVLIRKGMFQNGYLKDGELYKYQPSGKLAKTFYYKDGKVIKVQEH